MSSGEFLAIKNWAEYQPAYVSKGGKSSRWIKDYTEKETDAEYRSLTVFQRYILDGCRRICGRLGHNVPYDSRFVANQLNVSRSERGHVHSALLSCIDHGLLIVTNQRDSILLHKEESKNEKKKEPSATPRGERPKDPRFHHCVDILHRYWDKFIRGKVNFELWMDSAGYRQLKNSLKRSDALSVEEFTRCVANRARSPGVDHYEPAYKWLGHITEWAGGPKANGRGQAGQVSKADSREQRIINSAVRAAAAGAGVGESSNPLALPGNGGT